MLISSQGKMPHGAAAASALIIKDLTVWLFQQRITIFALNCKIMAEALSF